MITLNKYKKHILGNKRFFEIASPVLIKTTVTIQFNVGSIHDPVDKEGLSHLVEHLILRTKDKSKSYVEREVRGIYINAFTGRERTVYVASSYFLSAVEIVNELFSSLNYNVNTIELREEIEIITTEILQDKSNQSNANYNKALSECIAKNKSLFPYKHAVLGTEKSIKNITIDDIKSHIEKHYNTPLISVATPNKLDKNTIAKIFTTIDKNKFYVSDKELVSVENNIESGQFKFSNKNTQVFGFYLKNFSREREDVYLSVLKGYLANNWSSLCNKKMRIDKQLTYFVNNHCQIFSGFSIFYIYYDVTKKNKELAEKEYLNIIDDISKGKIDTEIFDASKKMLLSNTYDLLKDEENISNDFLWFNQYTGVIKQDNLYTIENFIESVKALEVKEFSLYLKSLFSGM